MKDKDIIIAQLQEELADAISRTYVPLDEMKKRIDAYWDGWRDALRNVAVGMACLDADRIWPRVMSQYDVLEALASLGDEDAKRMVQSK